MLKKTLLAAVLSFVFAAPAHASLLTITINNGSIVGHAYSSDGSVSGNIDISEVTGASGTASQGTNVSSGGSVIAKSPSGNLYDHEYFYVLGSDTRMAGLTLTSAVDTFGFRWGTLDTYNSVIVTDGTSYMTTITGTAILTILQTYKKNFSAGNDQIDLIIRDLGGAIRSIIWSSTGNTFEVANLTAIPLPAAFWLMLSALVALVGFSAYRRRAFQRI